MTRLLALGSMVVGLLLAGPPAAAQSTADSYFHGAAQAYVDGDRAAARRAVEQGLAAAPSDPRLIALRNKLRRSGPSEGRQDSSSATAGRRSGSSESTSSDEASDRGDTSSRSDEEGAPQPTPDASSTGGTSGSGRSSASAPPGQESDGARGRDAPRRGADVRGDTTGRGGAGRPVGGLSREQAERLLRALEGQERRLLRRVQPRSTERRSVEKDW